MPRQIKEIKGFNTGTISSASERDIGDNTPSFSLNIDSNSEAGILDAIKTDKIISTIDGSIARFEDNVSWGSSNLNNNDTDGPNLSRVAIDNIDIFEDNATPIIKCQGTKGRMENLNVIHIEPYFERVSSQTFDPAADIAVSDDSISYATDSSEMSGSTGSFVEISGLVVGDYFSLLNGTFTGRDSAEIIKVLYIDTDASKIYIKRRCFGTTSVPITTGATREERITLTNNRVFGTGGGSVGNWAAHGTNVVISEDSNTLKVTPADTGTNIQGAELPTTALETIVAGKKYRVSVDLHASHATQIDLFKIGIGGTLSAAFNITLSSATYTKDIIATSDAALLIYNENDGSGYWNIDNVSVQELGYDFYLNRRTLDSVQYSTKIGTCELYGWSDYSGNNINGSSSYIEKTTSTKIKYNGEIDTSANSQTITYNNTDKTITFAALSPTNANEFKFNEGDNITMYHSASSTNNGKTFKILKKEKVSTSIVLTVEGTMTDETESTDTVYTESNLLKNHTFEHVVSDGTITPAADAIYKCNDWIHKASKYIAPFDAFPAQTLNILEDDDGDEVSREATGGYWDDIQPEESGDASPLYYPFEATDAYMKIENDYQQIPYDVVEVGGTSIDTYLQFKKGTVAKRLKEYLAKNDIISFEASTFDGDTEYMKVLSVEEDVVRVQRGLFGTSLVAVASGAGVGDRRPWKCRSPRIMQSVESKYMKPGQRYKLCFYAQDEENAKGFSRGAIAITFNGGYINSSGVWTPHSSSNNNGYLSVSGNVVAQENKWIEFGSLTKPYGDVCELENGLDDKWRKFCLYFEMPLFDLKTDIDIEIANRGKNHQASNTSYVCIDLINLCEDTIVYSNTKGSSNILSVGKIDNKGSKEFVLYDSIKRKLNVLDLSSVYDDSSYGITYSPYASQELTNETNNLPMISNNREVHIGFGGTKNSTAPQWLGHINRKIFGKDFGEGLYQDEDTVHTYDKITANSLSKICLAGEYEYVKAYYNHTGSPVDDGEGGTLNLGAYTLRLYLTHNVNAGDNIIVRRWGDTTNEWDGSGLWIVTLSSNTAYFECKRYTTKDANPGTTGGAATEIKINYRPYHYYGCKAGEPYIYRIWPETRITSALAVDTVYIAGKIERSQPIVFPVNSICTYYAKEEADDTAATNGGRIYGLSSITDEVVVLDVNVAFNEWEKTHLGEYGPMTLAFKAYKWSNESIEGDLATDVGVFGGTAVQSTPTIEYAGQLTDILETKGTKETFNTTVTDYTTNTPFNLDTRLWVQSSPSGESNRFTEGDRFLFCGLTTETNTDGGDSIYVGDRTPATTSIISSNTLWDRYTDPNGGNGSMYTAAPGVGMGEVTAALNNSFYHFLQISGWMRRYCASNIDAKERYGNDELPDTINEFYSDTTNSYVSLLNLGWNIGWDINSAYGNDRVSFEVPKNALFAMGDNDGDGMIDGTGIVTCNTTSLPTTLNSRKMGPYGEKHRRVTSHCVGLIGASNKSWWRNWGRVSKVTEGSSNIWGTSPGLWLDIEGSDLSVDAPEKVSMEKFIAVCPDLHFGDMEMEHELIISSVDPTDLTGISGAASDKASEITFQSATATANLQAGDPVFIDGGGTISSTYIFEITAANKIKVPHLNTTLSISDGDILYPMTTFKQWKLAHPDTGSGTVTSGCLPNNQHYHWAHDLTDPLDSDVFTVRKYDEDAFDLPASNYDTSPVTYPGNFTKTFYSTPTRWGAGYNTSEVQGFLPGFIFKLSKLNYKAGLMLRPFDLADNTFEDMVVGNGLYVDMPSYPEAVYRKKLSSNTHSSLGTTDNENEFASRLFISSDSGADNDGQNLTNIYMCDLSLQYPFNLNNIPIESVTHTSWEDADALNEGKSWDIIVAGKLAESTSYVFADTTAYPGAHLHPYVVLPGYTGNELIYNKDILKGNSNWRDKNAFSGLCISILDAVTGKVQTRQIVYSDSAGGGTTDATDINIMVHYPFGHKPAQNDYYYIWSPELVNTAPVRLYKETALDHGLPNALIGDPILGNEIYKNNGLLATVSSTTNLATITTSTPHDLSNNDIVRLEYTEGTWPPYEGIHSITVTGPKTFTFAVTDGLETSETAFFFIWESVNSDTSRDNPLKLVNISSPFLKTTFGGLDMRKLRTDVTETTADKHLEAGTDSGNQDTVESTGHLWSSGDTVTIERTDQTASNHAGTYSIVSTDTNTFVIQNTDSTDDDNEFTISTNQFELILGETQGVGRMGEVRSGLNSWDKGNISDNIIRYDSSTASEDDRFLQIIEDNMTIKASSEATTSGYFLKNNKYEYKISFIYDGYQEGPLSQSVWAFGPKTLAYSRLELTIKLTAHSARLSHVCIYRRDTTDDSYKLVKELSTQSGWITTEDSQLKKVSDSGRVGASYESRTGMSEILDTIKLKYSLSTEIDGYLFAGDCHHDRIENASNQIFRSRPGMFSVFDYVNDTLVLKSKPTAMANFNGRLFVFDKLNIYKINPQSLMIEDIYEGIGCLSSNSLVVTEHGIFFADKNGAYLHNGSAPKKISATIYKKGSTEVDFESEFGANNTDNVRDFSWESIMNNNENIKVIYDSSSSSILYMFSFPFYIEKDDEKKSIINNYTWSYNIVSNRWDLWEICSDSDVGTPFMNQDSKVCIPIDNIIYEYKGGSNKRDYTWISKKITMGEDSIIKVFNKIKINGIESNLNLGGSNIESTNRLLVITSSGIPSVSYSTSASNHSDYQISDSSKKGHWIQFKAQNITEPIDSIGIIFRRKSTK